MNDYYTYAYLREDGTPYYIGKGRGRRAYQKSKRHKFVKVPDDKNRIVFLSQNLTEKDAFKEEKFLIKFYGRKIDGGILINITEGGFGGGRPPGWKHTEETKEKMRGKRPNAKIWNKGKKLPPKQRKCVYRDKEFDSIREAAEYFGVTQGAVYAYIKRRENELKTSNAKPCVIKGIEFDMIKSAAEYFGVTTSTIRNWLKNENYAVDTYIKKEKMPQKDQM
jgi:predicted DNA-binding protein YlxM (UPF0122 family)